MHGAGVGYIGRHDQRHIAIRGNCRRCVLQDLDSPTSENDGETMGCQRNRGYAAYAGTRTCDESD
ncbi:MAG: hypothetical protein SynsKO_32960 [Synoicihabitans sp.]